MARYAIVADGLVENVIVAKDAPPNGVLLAPDQAVSPGDRYDGTTFTVRVPDAAEIERRDAPGQLRQALALLATWQDDALSAAELGALTTAQRIARQAASEQRVAVLARMIRRLVIVQRLEG